MMSYLWILLLGSLLAAGANAQDDVADTEEAAASGTPAPEANAEPEVNGEPESEETAEEIPLPESEPEPEPATDAHPAAEDEEPEVAAGGDAEPTPAADAEEEAETPAAAADTEEEAAAPTPEPAVDPEVADPEAEQPTAEGEDETTSETHDATLAPIADGADDEATDPALADTTEAPTDPGVDAGPADPVVPLDKKVEQVEEHIPAVKEELEQPKVNPGFNLEDALEDKSQDKPKSRSIEQDAQAAGATGEADKPEAQVSNSGSVAGILCGLAVALVGAAAGYFSYQKKKLCFKNRQEADPEAARKADAAEAQADPQVLSTLLNSS